MDPSRFQGPGPSTASASSSTPRNTKKRKSPESATAPLPGRTASTGPGAGGAAAGDLSKVRAFAACRACRQKKVKCLPGPASTVGGAGNAACQQCTLSGAECEYQPTRDRAAYSRAYVQDLSGRVQALEAMQARLVPLLAAFEASGGTLPSALSNATAKAGGGGGAGSGAVRNTKAEPDGDETLSDEGGPHSPRSAASDEDQESRGFLADERGNFRWIGASNTLSLLDSFADSTKELPSRVRYGPHDSDDGESPSDEMDISPPESHPYFTPVAGAGTVRAVPGVESVTFPSRADAEKFVDAFFEDVHPVLPVVLEPDFRRRFKLIMDKVEVGDFTSLRSGPMSVLFAIFALGERVIKTSAAWQRERAKPAPDDQTVLPGEAEAGVIWFERAQVLHFSSIYEIDIHQVQCLTLLAAFQASVNAMPNAWILASQAMRIAQDIGLHRTAPRFKVSFKVKQLGSRCWWAVYGLERLVSVTLGRPLCVDDLDIDVAYPAEVDDKTIISYGDALTEEVMGQLPEEAPDSTMGGFVALTKLCKIAGRVAQLLYRPSNGKSVTDPTWAESQQRTIDKLHRLLQDWLEHEVPKKYKDASSSRSVSVMSAVLSNSYFSVMLALHRNLLPSNPDFPRPKPPPNSQSLALCVEAARSVIHVAAKSNVLVPVSHHIAVFCQYLWSSAVILLLCEVRAKEQLVLDAVGAQVESCHYALQALEPVWPGCKKLRDLLTDVETRAKEVRANVTLPRHVSKKRKSTSSENGAAVAATARRVPYPKPQLSDPGATAGLPPAAFERPALPQSTHTHTGMHLMPHTLDPSTFDIFDVGGMNFDGLEMLNAFTSDAWNAPMPTSVSPMGSAASSTPAPGGMPPLKHHHSQTQTPNQTQQHRSPASRLDPTPPSMAVPSPQTATGTAGAAAAASAWFTQGLGPAAPSPAPGPAELAEMWAQIAGTSFDWQADPNVPFQI